MKTYKTLTDEELSLNDLTIDQQGVLERVQECFNKKPSWVTFSSFWMQEVARLAKNGNRKEVADSVLFRICQDLESRLGIDQGYTREAD